MKLENLELKRLTVHKIYGRSKTNDAPYASECTELTKLGADGMETLHKRVNSCINHKSKFYELDLSDKSEESFFEIHKSLCGARLPKFLSVSQLIADKVASTHENANIPDGLILIIEAKISGLETVITIKAEKSNAFSLAGNDLQLVKDIFLSSDKTLYKLGFFIRRDSEKETPSAYRFYVYDDAFSPSKEDLAHYFYNKFLGLTTEKNSKLLTNKFHRALIGFAQDHIDFGDKYEVMRSIDRAFLDTTRKSLTASEFKSFFPSELDQLFDSVIAQEFPNSFVKDNSIINSIETKRIALSSETTLLLKNAPDGIITGSTKNANDLSKLKVSIDSGNNYNFALVPSIVGINPIKSDK
jgi:hypothetical protein